MSGSGLPGTVPSLALLVIDQLAHVLDRTLRGGEPSLVLYQLEFGTLGNGSCGAGPPYKGPADGTLYTQNMGFDALLYEFPDSFDVV